MRPAALATSGLSNKQIAHMLGLSEGSAKQHLHRAFMKLGIQRRAHLIPREASLWQS
jgi:DNA-binding CsgD family transcriptional regulator